jgi:hypothetical protein
MVRFVSVWIACVSICLNLDWLWFGLFEFRLLMVRFVWIWIAYGSVCLDLDC